MGRITTVITSGLALTIIRHLKDLTLGVQSNRSKKEKEKKVTITSPKPVTTILTICVQVSEKIMIITPALYHHPAVAMAIIPD